MFFPMLLKLKILKRENFLIIGLPLEKPDFYALVAPNDS